MIKQSRPFIFCLLILFAGGCESLQRKFTRKPKTPVEQPAPIIHFQDYSQGMTVLDRYQKHFLMFEYWNNDLIDSLQTGRYSVKRIRRASEGALNSMRTLHELLRGEEAEKFKEILDQREKLDRNLNRSVTPGQVDDFRRRAESQTRATHREFYWTKVKDKLRADTDVAGSALETQTPEPLEPNP